MNMHTAATRIAAASVLVFAGTVVRPASAAVIDGFEAFGGASGTSVAGYAGWTDITVPASAAVGNASTVITSGGGYASSNFLRLVDASTAATTGTVARKTFGADSVALSGSPVSISFALRTSASGAQNQVVLFRDGGFGNASIALQAGIRAADNKFSYTSWAAGVATNNTLAPAAVAGVWYRFDIAYTLDAATGGTYSMKITDTAANAVVYNGSNLIGQTTFVNPATATLAALHVQTSDSGAGNSDFDALSVTVPEPATMAAAVAGAAIMLRRRRRQA